MTEVTNYLRRKETVPAWGRRLRPDRTCFPWHHRKVSQNRAASQASGKARGWWKRTQTVVSSPSSSQLLAAHVLSCAVGTVEGLLGTWAECTGSGAIWHGHFSILHSLNESCLTSLSLLPILQRELWSLSMKDEPAIKVPGMYHLS